LPVPWNDDDPRDLAVIEQNLGRVLRRIVERALYRETPSVEMAQAWHRRIYRNVPLPVPYYAGGIRGIDPDLPELVSYEVAVGGSPGVPSRYVSGELLRLERFLGQAVGRLDPRIPASERPTEPGEIHSVLTLCAISHGEWVRIHPFANGNGKTARLWANWCALRYGLPPFVRLRPRPAGDAYALAAADSMHGDHRAMAIVFLDLLTSHLLEHDRG
jgi:hypothetical protein